MQADTHPVSAVEHLASCFAQWKQECPDVPHDSYRFGQWLEFTVVTVEFHKAVADHQRASQVE